MENVVALVLGGGRGTRLSPLTDYRAKPAVPLGGKYRLVDVPLSNCLHNNLFNIYVLTQFESASLNRHISQTYRFDQFRQGQVEVLAAEERLEPSPGWFQGTADAVRQTFHHTYHPTMRHCLILAGDALYRMDFRALVKQHIETDADLTVACKTVGAEQAGQFGIMQIDAHNHIESFSEKPGPTELEGLAMDPVVLKSNKLDDPTRPYLASMGIYAFKFPALERMLSEPGHIDFGKHIIPASIARGKVFAFPFAGYWEDVGTIRSYYEANLDLTDSVPAFNLYDMRRPIYTRQRFLPAIKIQDSHPNHAMIGEGSILLGATIRRSVLGIRSVIRSRTVVENTVMNGADYYDMKELHSKHGAPECPTPIGIGEDCVIRNAIIDKNVRIGNGVRIMNEAGHTSSDGANYAIRDGIVVVKKGAYIPDGTVI